MRWVDENEHWEEEDGIHYLIDGVGFAEPGSGSALRAATKDNPRDQKCPSCNTPNVLTRIDVQRGYQCDSYAVATERGLDIQYYEGPEEDE